MSQEFWPMSQESLAHLRKMITRLADLPKPVCYIVIDPSLPHGRPLDTEDADGRRYLLVNSAVLDEMKHTKFSDIQILTANGISPLAGIPLYRRKDMPPGWPAEKILP